MGAEKITKIVPIILAGGKGSRLWPISRKSFPKQFLNLFNEEYTLLQETYKRIENIGDLTNPLIICNEEHRFIVGHQMKAINIRPLSILLEPEGRNTTPAITIAALKALEIYKDTIFDPILLILSSDHQIDNVIKFHTAIQKGLEVAKRDNLAIFGIRPESPSTDYGYIKAQCELSYEDVNESKVDHFIEKPNKKTAKLLLKDKKYSWNSGMFIFKASSILNEIKKFAPDSLKEVVSSLNKKGFDEAQNHKKVYRPWGSFLSLEAGDSWQIKKIDVNPGASLSLQKHLHRSEHWVVVCGTAKIEIGNIEKRIGTNESAYIPLGVKHRLSNPTDLPLVLIEIQSGSYLGEDDIERFEDLYQR
jgi:mannose-1-phosphate guanylyltransferase